ncbi:unnamed protein product [Blepharisma stoltei]|uniref:Uncharacterized protein n=1 Tax=Blepharisma stoltei TaxID=1481888 RepID=A0AAU9IQY2_9CILI|nr:unnamed protein product [Blepharisma stoltei]
MLSSPKTTAGTLEYYEDSETSKASSNTRINEDLKSQEEFLSFTIRRILPPIFTVKNEDNELPFEAEEADLFKELNNQKICNIQ